MRLIFGSISSIISLLTKFWVTFFSLLEIFTETIILLEIYLLLYAAQKLEFFSEVLRFKNALCSTIYTITYLNYGYWNGALIWLSLEMVFFIVGQRLKQLQLLRVSYFFKQFIAEYIFLLLFCLDCDMYTQNLIKVWGLVFFCKFFCAKLMILANLSLLPWTHFMVVLNYLDD